MELTKKMNRAEERKAKKIITDFLWEDFDGIESVLAKLDYTALGKLRDRMNGILPELYPRLLGDVIHHKVKSFPAPQEQIKV